MVSYALFCPNFSHTRPLVKVERNKVEERHGMQVLMEQYMKN